MPTPSSGTEVPAAAVAEVEALLAESAGTPVTVERIEPLPGHAWVLRAHLAPGAAGLPASVVVKELRPEGYGLRSAEELARCERAALAFIADGLGLGALAPRLLAAAPDSRLLVLEDLAPRVDLSRLLRRDGLTPDHAADLTAFATATGELAAASAGRAAEFDARRTALGTPGSSLGDWEHAYFGLWRTARVGAADVGLPLPSTAERELAELVAELADPGPFLVLTNGDAEPHNFMAGPGGADDTNGPGRVRDGRLIDFEGAGYRHALTAASCFAVPGPGWLATSGPEQIDAFRTALARSVPEAEDDGRFGYGLAAASMVWVVMRSGRFAMLDGRAVGDHSRLQTVSLLEAGARTATGQRVFPHLAGWCRATADALRRRWPDTDVDTAAIPPFTWRER